MNFHEIYRLFAKVDTTFEKEYYNAILGFLTTQTGYFLNFPIEGNATKVNNSNSPIIDSAYFNWDYTENNNYNCVASIRQI